MKRKMRHGNGGGNSNSWFDSMLMLRTRVWLLFDWLEKRMFMELQQQRMPKRKYPNSRDSDGSLIPCESVQTARNELHSISGM